MKEDAFLPRWQKVNNVNTDQRLTDCLGSETGKLAQLYFYYRHLIAVVIDKGGNNLK